MTINQLRVELERGDVVNGKDIVTLVCSDSVVTNHGIRAIQKRNGIVPILTVSRNGVEYYRRITHGGNRR